MMSVLLVLIIISKQFSIIVSNPGIQTVNQITTDLLELRNSIDITQIIDSLVVSDKVQEIVHRVARVSWSTISIDLKSAEVIYNIAVLLLFRLVSVSSLDLSRGLTIEVELDKDKRGNSGQIE